MRVAIITLIPNKTGFVWFPVEVDFVSLPELHTSLIETEVLVGVKLETRQEGDQRIIAKRVPCIIGRGMIGMITPLDLDLTDPAAE